MRVAAAALLSALCLALSPWVRPTWASGGAIHLTIATGGAGGIYQSLGNAIARMLSSSVPGIRVFPQPSGASRANLALLESDQAQLAIVQSDVLHMSVKGLAGFRRPKVEVRAIASLHVEHLHVVVDARSPIEDLTQLVGRRVSVGAAGSGTELDARLLLMELGIPYSRMRTDFLGFSESAERLKRGEIDAFFAMGGIPLPAVAELSRSIPLRLLPIPEEVVARLRGRYPFVEEGTIPAGLYGDHPEAKTISVRANLVCRADLGEDLVYSIARALWERIDEIRSAHPRTRDVRLSEALRGLGAPLHPGAARFYREKGMLN